MVGDDHEHDEDRAGPMQLTTWVVLGLAVVLIASLVGVRLEHQPDTSREYPPRPQIPDGENVLLPAPEVNDDYFPCDDCHEPDDSQMNLTVRELEEEHEEMKFAHGNLWCLHCHDAQNRVSLHLADASLVAFEDSWQLCTQCHTKKLPDWRAGVHGKRTGHWRGPKEFRTCVVCHDPHDPPFKPIEPKPAPKRPTEIIQNVMSAPPTSATAGKKEGEGREDS